MHPWSLLSLAIVGIVTANQQVQGALYPWAPPSWWVRAPEKDTPASVQIQQQGGNYVYSTLEGKAYQQAWPPVAAVHVQAIPPVAVHYLPSGQAVLVPALAPLAPPVQPSANPEAGSAGNPEAGRNPEAEDNNPATTEPQQREPAPVTEQQSDDYDTDATERP